LIIIVSRYVKEGAMEWRQHGLSATLAWLTGVDLLQAAGVRIGPAAAIGGTVVAFAGGLLPDIDHCGSKAAHSLGSVSETTAAGAQRLWGHRQFTHWPATHVLLGVFVGALVAAIIPALWWLGLAIAAGCLSHSLGDALTREGAPLLGPFSDRLLGLPQRLRFCSGGRFELLVVGPVVAAGAVVAALVYVERFWPVPSVANVMIVITVAGGMLVHGAERSRQTPLPGRSRRRLGV
jgi:membrane-bound metal-dependent hydrolase YbcI (DUF457 family)